MLGVQEGFAYPVSELVLAAGNSVFLYTDGITEAMGVNREQFSEARLHQALEQHRALVPDALTQRVIETVQGYASETEQSDDMTCLALRRL